MTTTRQSQDEAQQALTALQALLAEQEQALAQMQAQQREIIQQAQSAFDQQAALLQARASSASERTEEDYKLSLALTLANSAYDALLVVDADNRIIAINDSAEALFNRKRPIGEFLDEVTGVDELNLMVDDAKTNQEETFEEQVNIDRRVYRVRTRVIMRAGNRFIGLAFQDISELVRLNRARRDMVANISHELRTPIANIRLIIESLFHEQDRPKRKQSTSALKAIARETDSLIWLVQELLDLSMIESGQAILRMVDQSMHQLVVDAIERLDEQSVTRQIAFVNQVPPEIQVLADGDHVRRVLVNLMHNALKWSPPGESVFVRAEIDGDVVITSVIDNGPGVPEAHRERIFERFYQVDPSRSGKEGTGLGLAICRHVVEAHEGRIWVESNPDRTDGLGGCFRFTLPLGESVPLAQDGPETSAS
ncbi:MAG: ATP-binding protein [Anaerolineae bacterium]|nr:ATP-binding protein [Anaerolineae bacterium]NUQ05194.1 PAS domain-containing protein [Anaerolineae bacterium]